MKLIAAAATLLSLAPTSEAIYIACCETTTDCAEYYNTIDSYDKNGTTFNSCCYPDETPDPANLPECAPALAKNEVGIALMTLDGNETAPVSVSGMIDSTQDLVAGVVNSTANLIPELTASGDECSQGTDCTSCLNINGCSWSPDADQCLSSCAIIADASCFDGTTYDSSVCSTIVESTCGQSTDCESCLSDESKGCTWFQYDGYTGYCETGCGMNGCGASVCPSQLTNCQDCLGGDGTKASGQYSWSPDANECLGGCDVLADAACFEAKSSMNPSGYDPSICEEYSEDGDVSPSAPPMLAEDETTFSTEAASMSMPMVDTDETEGASDGATSEVEEGDKDTDAVGATIEGEDGKDSAAHVQLVSIFASLVSTGLFLGSL
eukprot:scaffold1823_cov38-Cyclotella_meneghiniana.AAC.5